MNMTEEEYEQAETFWDRKDEKGKKMESPAVYQWADAFLSKHKVLSLATGSGEWIRCTPLEYSWHDGALWIFTEGGHKFRSLKENEHVAAAVYDTDTSFGKLHSVQIEGSAEVVELYSEEYKKAAAFRKIPLVVLKKLPEPMWLLKVTPSVLTCLNSDFKKKGFDSRQIWRAREKKV